MTPPPTQVPSVASYGPLSIERQRTLLIRMLRMAFFVLIITIAILNAPQGTVGRISISWWIPILIAVVLVGIALTVDLATPNKKIAGISGVFFGIFAGMLATYALSSIIDLLLKNWLEPKYLSEIGSFIFTVKILVGITLCYLGITTVLQTQDDFRLVIPYVEFAKQIRGPKPLLLDTSALIDARIVDLGSTGLLQTPLVIPHFVVAELQLLADSPDRMRRAKGRRGLDVIGRLQRAAVLDVTIDETPVPGKNVDQMLVELARRMPGTIVTADVALARIAQIQGVTILNLNDVANALKPALIPGEQLTVRPIKPGEQPGQGVGYLEDGTMIVVEQGGDRIGMDVLVEVTSSLQTSAGRLIFARPTDLGPKSGIINIGVSPEQRAANERSGSPIQFAAPSSAAAPPPAGPPPAGPAPAVPASAAATPAAVAAPSPAVPAAPAPPPPTVIDIGAHSDLSDSGTPIGASPGGSRAGPGPFPPKQPSRTATGRNPRR